MKYKERWRKEKAQEIKKKRFCKKILQRLAGLVIILSLVGVFLGLGCLDNGNTKEAAIFTLVCIGTGCGTACICDLAFGEEEEEAWE